MNKELLSPEKNSRNEVILLERVAAFNERSGPRVGDYLKMPYGLYTRFTHAWDDHIQTGGNQESFFLGKFISYSGGLDSGVKLSDIRQTEEIKKGWVWFFDGDHARANGSVHYEIDFRVFELIEGADTSGLPQIKAHEKKLKLQQVETITRLNGNGAPYTKPLPEVLILKDAVNDYTIKRIEQETGLAFENNWTGHVMQPMTREQLLKIILILTCLKCTEYDNSIYNNTLMFEPRK